MKIAKFFILSMVAVSVSIGGNVFAMDLGQVGGAWEPNGHWKTAGTIGIVCEERDSKKDVVKVKVYQWNGSLYEEYKDYRFWPKYKSCAQVTTADLRENFKGITYFVEDNTFVADGGEKHTMRRWFFRQ